MRTKRDGEIRKGRWGEKIKKSERWEGGKESKRKWQRERENSLVCVYM